ncbi:MAG: hypothetical protein AVDCRST_MAG91-1168, partial [uncultured Sphingomonadaceae bacterium]
HGEHLRVPVGSLGVQLHQLAPRPARGEGPQTLRPLRRPAFRGPDEGKRDRDRGRLPARRHTGVARHRIVDRRWRQRQRRAGRRLLPVERSSGPVERGGDEGRRTVERLHLGRLDRSCRTEQPRCGGRQSAAWVGVAGDPGDDPGIRGRRGAGHARRGHDTGSLRRRPTVHGADHRDWLPAVLPDHQVLDL